MIRMLGVIGSRGGVMIRQVIDFLVPRFLTEAYGCIEDEGGETCCPVCTMRMWQFEDGDPDYVIVMRGFNFFGWLLFPRHDGEAVAYQDWKEGAG